MEQLIIQHMTQEIILKDASYNNLVQLYIVNLSTGRIVSMTLINQAVKKPPHYNVQNNRQIN